MICEKCGNEIPEGATYCPECGARSDGKVKCPSCGKFVAPKPYCTECGARTDGKTEEGASAAVAQKPKRERPRIDTRKVLNYTAFIALGCAALFSLIFVFCLGVNLVSTGYLRTKTVSQSIYYYFGDGYRAIKKAYPILSKEPAGFRFAVYLPMFLGTLISTVTMLGVIICAALTVVAYIKKFVKKQRVSIAKPALATYLIFAIGATALLALQNESVKIISKFNESYNYTSGCQFNGATVAGLVLSSHGVAVFIACVVANERHKFNRQKIFKVSAVCGLGILAIVAVALSLAPTVNFKYSDRNYSTYALNMGLMTMLTDVTTGLGGLSDVANETFRLARLRLFTTFGFIAQLLMLVLMAILIYRVVRAVAFGIEFKGVGLSLLACFTGLIYMLFAILAGSNVNAILFGTEVKKIIPSYGSPIATGVITVVLAACCVAYNKISVRASEN